MQHFGQILPVDGYVVRLSNSLPADYLHSLIHLYQPLVGMEAISLYQTLLLELDFEEEKQTQTHHTLMNYLNMPLDELYEARLKLEGIGLVKTYKFESEDSVTYTYILREPFTPQAFFADMMLSELLFRHIGKSKFSFLKNHYTKVEEPEIGEDITATFGDVFQTYQSYGTYEPAVRPEKTSGVPIATVDFRPIEQALQRKMIPVSQVLTEQNKRMIAQLMQLYDLETYEMEKSIFWALNEENLLDIEQLKAACHDIFKGKHNVTDISLAPKSIKSVEESPVNERKNLSPEEQLIERLETITPKELLEDLSGGHNASEQDMKLITSIMLNQGLPQPVMNVLLHYVLLQSDMKLSRPYLEKIASHWSRSQLKTAKEAMAFARKQAEPQPKRKWNYRSNRQSKEIIPDWFKEEKHKQQEPKKAKQSKQEDVDQEALIALLKRHTSEK